jgi:beta-galactosidase/beta-glucuronidase
LNKSGTEEWQPAPSQLVTRWSKDVNPECPLPEYPRPQFARIEWLNLNGLWDYAITSKGNQNVETYQDKILVPFPIESALSGVGKKLSHKQSLIYRRFFSIPEAWADKRIILNFGAVDWEAQVFVNESHVGEHRGGYLPFSFDITNHLVPGSENELRVSVWDPTDKGKQERGKQSLKPKIVFYTAVSGIWQTVWLESVSEVYIESCKILPDIDNSQISVEATIVGDRSGEIFRVRVNDPSVKATIAEAIGDTKVVLDIPNAKLWSPEDPFLYDVTLTMEREGQVIDKVSSYAGMRKISLSLDEKGVPRLALNNEVIFQYGPLDQGYWPDGLYTAPTDDALRYDVEIMKDLGFNMVRKHVKIEPLRWYHHCDRLGLLVWQDMPNGGSFSILTFRMEIHQGRSDPEVREQYSRELGEMIDSLYNCPSIVMWVPFNEGWGQFETEKIVDKIREWDSSRLVNEASGWFDKRTGDVSDAHNYPDPIMPDVEESRASVLGEFGGLGLLDSSHTWHPNRLFGIKKYYHGFDKSLTGTELTSKYLELVQGIKDLIPKGLSAAVYTQLTDIEGEINGYLTYDRGKMKMDKDRLVQIHHELVQLI